MAHAPHYPTHQNLPPAYERQVWPPEGASEVQRYYMSHTPALGGKDKMSKKARLRLRAYHHVLTRRRGELVEVVIGDCVQGERRNNVLPRRYRKIDSYWVSQATHGLNEQFQDASYERRLTHVGAVGRLPEEVILGDVDGNVIEIPDAIRGETLAAMAPSRFSMDTVVSDASTNLRADLQQRLQEVSRG